MTQTREQKIQEIQTGSFSDESKKKAADIYSNQELSETEADLLVDTVLAEELEQEAHELGISTEPTKKEIGLAKDALGAQGEVSEFIEGLK